MTRITGTVEHTDQLARRVDVGGNHHLRICGRVLATGPDKLHSPERGQQTEAYHVSFLHRPTSFSG
jgi:hypothetical protein